MRPEIDEELGDLDIEIEFLEKDPWWKRVTTWFRGLFQPKKSDLEFSIERLNEILGQQEDVEVPESEWDKRKAVANVIEAALASVTWVNSELEAELGGSRHYYVVGMKISDRGDGTYWLEVVLSENISGRQFAVPLHDFLTQCEPLNDLTFTDYHA